MNMQMQVLHEDCARNESAVVFNVAKFYLYLADTNGAGSIL
jgi:hypothetical protein